MEGLRACRVCPASNIKKPKAWADGAGAAGVARDLREPRALALPCPSPPHPQAELVVKIAELVEAKTLTGVADVRDESDRQGLRVVVEVGGCYAAFVPLSAFVAQAHLQCEHAP